MNLNCESLIDKHICNADCCGPVQFTRSFLNSHKHLFQRDVKKYIEDGDLIMPITRDIICVFNHPETKRCVIYAERPTVCIEFGSGKSDGKESLLMYCPHLKPSGRPWSEAKKKWLDRKISKILKETVKKYEVKETG